MTFKLTDAPIDPAVEAECLTNRSAGAISTFEGRVRDFNDGKKVTALTYEAYGELADIEGATILEETGQRFNILRAACIHRIGDLEIGEIAVWVGVSAAHREDAFKACRFIIDEIKHRLPIWKHETYTDGTKVWVNCRTCQAPPRDTAKL